MLTATYDSCSNAAADSACVDIVLSKEGHDLVRDGGIEALDTELRGRPCCIVPSADFAKQLARLPSASGQMPRILSGFGGDDRFSLLLEVSSELSWFEGHFPGQPVLPGIIQLHWANVIATALFELDGLPHHIKRLKFSNVIVPPRIVELVLERPAANEVQFRIHGAGLQNSQGRLVFGASGS